MHHLVVVPSLPTNLVLREAKRRKPDRDIRERRSKETVESMLSSVLRVEDKELDEILRALDEISRVSQLSAPDLEALSQALQRAAQGAVKQSLLDRELRHLAITDDLTGLYNRRGFLASATHQLKMAQRKEENLLLFFCDLDNLKAINDCCGHKEGDLALVHTADVLEKTFRDSDILARFSGDEFTVLASEASGQNQEIILSRLEENLMAANAEGPKFRLSLSIGVARFDPKSPISLGELMARAEGAMYEHKAGHHRNEHGQPR
jgi:diguanylate cyclase (GGDEF)-like protein